jgi:hypothetical protein
LMEHKTKALRTQRRRVVDRVLPRTTRKQHELAAAVRRATRTGRRTTKKPRRPDQDLRGGPVRARPAQCDPRDRTLRTYVHSESVQHFPCVVGSGSLHPNDKDLDGRTCEGLHRRKM